MTAPLRRWAGVDVGAGKGFDLAVIATDRLVGGPARIVGVPEAARWLRDQGPRVVAVDAPRSAAADGELSRPEERDLVKAKVCGIRYTPSRAALDAGGSYYAWIRSGLELYRALGTRSARR